MTKKSFAVALVFFALLFSSSFIYASSNLGDELKDSWNKTAETANNVGGAVKNTANNVGGAVANTTNGAMNTTQNTGRAMTTNNNNGAYTATRTSTNNGTGNFMGLNSMALTWIVLAITGVVIVSLIWYYGSQFDSARRTHNDD